MIPTVPTVPSRKLAAQARMSDSYANRLSKGVDYGVCGLPELYDTDEDLEIKLQRLVDLVRASKFTVVHTGAGW